MKLVKFKNGKYGVRYGFLGFYRYQDFEPGGFTWSRKSRFFPDCQTTEGEAREFIERRMDAGRVVR